MSAVDPQYAQWLQADGLWQTATDTSALQRWGSTAVTSERMTALAFPADAEVEGERQIAFLGGPLALDRIVVPGAWENSTGQVVTITGNDLGYAQGRDVFVLKASDERSRGISRLLVAVRL